MNDVHVWVVQDKHDRIRFVGTGDRASAYASHGTDVDERRDKKKSRVRTSSTAFSSAEDAQLAANLLAQAVGPAQDKPVQVVAAPDDESMAGGFVAGLPTRRKTLHYRDLRKSVVVRVDLDDLVVDGGVVSGVHRPREAADAVRSSWSLNRVVDDELPVRRLVVVTGASIDPPRVVGIWKVKDVDAWVDHGGGNWTIGVKKRSKGDRGGHVGRRFDWDGYQAVSFGYSHDLRVMSGLAEPVDEDADDT